MDRYLFEIIQRDALHDHKMAFITGPRQVGKTYLAKSIIDNNPDNYFNWDEKKFKIAWAKDPLKSIEKVTGETIVIDEIHKYRFWKNSLKGFYDHLGDKIKIIVTGSARLDLYKKGGDSLLGRYLPYRLHPFSVSENSLKIPTPDQLEVRSIQYPLDDLYHLSGFPEPLLKGEKGKAKRWANLRMERLMFFDVREISFIKELELLKLYTELFPSKVGSPLSLNSLREDLNVSYSTVVDWTHLLKNLFFCFQVPPYDKKINRSLKKESKYYLYDWTNIENEGARKENIVAFHLLKSCHYWTDSAQGTFELFYLRTRDGREVDFCILRDKKPWMLVEVKSSQTELSPHLNYFNQNLSAPLLFQLTDKDVDKTFPAQNIRLINIEKFLSMLV